MKSNFMKITGFLFIFLLAATMQTNAEMSTTVGVATGDSVTYTMDDYRHYIHTEGQEYYNAGKLDDSYSTHPYCGDFIVSRHLSKDQQRGGEQSHRYRIR